MRLVMRYSVKAYLVARLNMIENVIGTNVNNLAKTSVNVKKVQRLGCQSLSDCLH